MAVVRGVQYGSYKKVLIEVGSYFEGGLAVLLTHEADDGHRERLTKCTVNLPNQKCPPDEVWIKNWSENTGMVEWMVNNRIIERRATASTTSSFVVVQRFKLTPEFIEELSKCQDS